MLDVRYIERKLDEFLQSRTPPKGITEDGLMAERRILANVIAKKAPKDGMTVFVDDVLQRLAETSETRTWPTAKAVATACAHVSGKAAAMTEPPTKPWTYSKVVSAIKDRQPVPEHMLWSPEVHDALAKGDLTPQDVDRYRVNVLGSRSYLYGEEAARKFEAEMNARMMRLLNDRDEARRRDYSA